MMTENDPTNGAGKASRHWVLVLLFVLAMLAGDSVRRMDYILACTHNRMGLPLLLPELDATSTGYVDGQRRLVLPAGGYDGYHFLLQTHQRIAAGDWRVRHVDYDNYPHGREQHWASLLSWILEATAWCDSLATGHSLEASLERVAPYAHTLFFVVTLLVLVPLTARRFGSTAASVLALGLMFVPAIYEFHFVGNFDHHGLIATFGMASLLSLVAGGAGWVRDESPTATTDGLARWLPDEQQARRWFTASAIAGGAALWVSCATQIPVFVGLGLGVLLGAVGSGRPDGPWRYEPKLWRGWARIGAATSLFFYLVEYFPFDMGMRLEVNHPLYALAWLGGGEVMYQAGRWLREGKRAVSLPGALALALGLSALAAAPAVIRLYPETFVVQDRFFQLMTKNHVLEGRPVWIVFHGNDALSNWIMFNCLPLLGLFEVWLLFGKRLPRPYRGVLLLVLLPSLVMTALTVYQIRWLGTGLSVWLVNLTALLGVLPQAGLSTPARKAGLALFVFVVMVPGLHYTLHEVLLFGRQRLAGNSATELQGFDIDHLLVRDTAYRLRRRIGTAPGAVLAGPTDTTTLIFHGGFPGMGNLYWENFTGLKVASAIFTAPTFEQAFELIQSRDITHLVLTFGQEATDYVRLGRRLDVGDPTPDDAFALVLLKGDRYPDWLRPVQVPIPEDQAFKDRRILVFEVVPKQGAREAALRRAQYHHRRQQNEAADEILGAVLREHPNYLAALVHQALVNFDRKETADFQMLMKRIDNNMPQADTLDLEDRLNLMRLLECANRHEEARGQCVRCLKQADARSLRRLDEKALAWFLQRARDGDLGQVRPEIIELGSRLIAGPGRHP